MGQLDSAARTPHITDNAYRLSDCYYEGMILPKEVIERLLLAKSLLLPSTHAPWAAPPDAHLTARLVLTAHDAADLVFAAIADHQGKLNAKRAPSMIECLALIDSPDPKPSDYFGRLNEVRNGLKHRGNLPNVAQWGRAGAEVYEKLSGLCNSCLQVSLESLDESELIASDGVKGHFQAAKLALEGRDYKSTLEELGKALCVLLEENPALRDVHVGRASAEDAIKLTGYGVHANDFLTLQEFLPEVWRFGSGPFELTWKQSKFGHAGNWRADAAEFCLRAFLETALRIQHASWVPMAVPLEFLFKYRITPVEDDVVVWEDYLNPTESIEGVVSVGRVVRHLRKGESVTVSAIFQPLMSESYEPGLPSKRVLVSDVSIFGRAEFVDFNQVSITCVPKDIFELRKRFPYLKEIPWQSDDPASLG
jgi:hypothetical protein